MKKSILFIFYACPLLLFWMVVGGCDKCKYTKSNPILLDYASITFSLYTITENFQIRDFFTENLDYYPDSLRLFDINHQEIYLQRTLNKNEFTFYFVDDKVKKNIFNNIIVQYYYLRFNISDTDTMKLEMKGQYTGDCDNEAFELMRMYYNNTMVINGAPKGKVAFSFTYHKKN